jgi:hypothetical protein
MLKQLKIASSIGAITLATIAASPAMGAAVGAEDLVGRFWTPPMMKAMDTNKDGMVSRDEFMTYMGEQFDKMDQNRDKMLNTKEFTDKKMMHATFPLPTD